MGDCFTFRFSRWKNSPYLILAFGLLVIGSGFVFGEIYQGNFLEKLFFILAGLFLITCGLFVFLISLNRLIRKPIVLKFDAVGIHYFYSTLTRYKKVIVIPWKNIVSIKAADLTIYNSKEIAGKGYVLPSKIDFIELEVIKGTLDAYGTWKNNIFLNSNKDKLSIVSADFARFSEIKLQEVIKKFSPTITDETITKKVLK